MGLAIIIPGISFPGDLGKVTPSIFIRVTSVTIDNGTFVEANKYRYAAIITPDNATVKRVNWSVVSGNAYATIDASGLLSVLEGADGAEVVIRATSVSNQSVYAEKTLTVTHDGTISYDVFYQKASLSGTVSDYVNTGISLHSDENEIWSMLIKIPPLSVAASLSDIKTLLAANNQSSQPYDGFSVISLSGLQLFPRMTAGNNNYWINPITGQVITSSSQPGITPDGNMHSVIISRNGTNYTYSLDGENWMSLANGYTPTSDAKSAVLTLGGALISSTPTRFPSSDSPATIALKLGVEQYPFTELLL